MELIFEHWFNYSKIFDNTTTVGVLIVIAVVTVLYYVFRTRGLPPGPIGLPFLGYSPFLKPQTCHLVLEDLQKKYGDLFCFRFAGMLYINMGSLKAIREIHISRAECFERISDFSLLSYLFGDGVGFINGEPWKMLRKFCLQQFRESGMTTIKDNMTGPLYDSIKETVDYLREKKGEPVEILQLLTDKCTSITRLTLFGGSRVTDRQIREMNESYGHTMTFLTVPNMLYTGKTARYLFFPLKSGYRDAVKHHKMMEKLLMEVVNDHKEKFRDGDHHHRNFVDAFLNERNVRYSKGDPTAEFFTDKALISTLVQFVGDGVLSVAAFATLFLKAVVDHPECQEKIYQEIVEVVGQSRAPSIEDKSRMTYTNAFIMEIIRTSEFGTAFPSQQCIKETTVRGYKIPKGAMTLMNVWSCHHDPNIYENPEKFDPTRFIPENGKQRPELPNIFGVGKRACIGEGFAMAQVFLFLATIIQNFQLSNPKQHEKVPLFELIMSGKVEICATPRNEAEIHEK
nr:cytochrome P450 2H1 isoform X1 [Parasteatoda tepidariorum]